MCFILGDIHCVQHLYACCLIAKNAKAGSQIRTLDLIMMKMAKYSKKAQEKIGEVMKEFKEGDLKTSAGDKVTDRDQAVAIGISEAKQEGYKVPKQKKNTSKSNKKKK